MPGDDEAIILRLTRGRSDGEGTFGGLTLPDGWSCVTVELPWVDNKRGVSCIPAGTYSMHMRESGVVGRTTKWRYKYGWHIEDVPGRSLIMIHVANSIYDLDGCIGLGRDFARWGVNPQTHHYDASAPEIRTVSHSLDTFTEFMSHMAPHAGGDVRIQIIDAWAGAPGQEDD